MGIFPLTLPSLEVQDEWDSALVADSFSVSKNDTLSKSNVLQPGRDSKETFIPLERKNAQLPS